MPPGLETRAVEGVGSNQEECMATKSAFVKLGAGASVVGALLVILYIVLKVAEADIANLGLLLGVGLVLFVGGLVGGVWVHRSD